MTVAATYDDTEELGRVRLTLSGYSSYADFAKIERSIDGVNWTTVRGGSAVPLLSGAATLDDYEFRPNLLNTYRVSTWDTATPSLIAQGTGASAVNASVTPGLPAGLQKGDLMVLHAAIRNSGTGTVNVPAGWTVVTNTGNMLLAVRSWVSGDTAPTVTFNNGAANEDTTAYIFGIRNVDPTPYQIATPLLNGSFQNVDTPAITYPANSFFIRYAWKQDDYTTFDFSPLGNAGGVSTVTGNDSSIFAGGIARPTAGTWPLQNIPVTGGAAAISRAGAASFVQRAVLDQDTTTITPTVTRYRIKNPQRPSLNRYIEPLPLDTPISRTSRTGAFAVQGRNLPVIVSDVMNSRSFTLKIDSSGYAQTWALDQVFVTGEPLYLEVPITSGQLPCLYFVITGELEIEEDANGTGSYTISIPLTECAAPAASVAGATFLYSDVSSTYATYADVLAGVATYADLLNKVSTAEVVVP